ncbi:MAG: ATP-NAD kinase [Gammaproteobacteria bacterium]|nr:MAG: ATP-NAD kinase [Pseudomonadota bacterium]PIE39078.1 MAG: ATP-NAD kinase [Gammaproteobacteria bacterium]
MKLSVGLIVNPIAGIGGKAALKGSDGDAATIARARGFRSAVTERVATFLAELDAFRHQITLLTCQGEMGERVCRENAWQPATVVPVNHCPTTAGDTKKAALSLKAQGVDLLVFAGGDGTARDVFDAVGDSTLVVGLPSGVKMHSGVFAINPVAAARVVIMLIRGEVVSGRQGEVRDLDESLLRSGQVQSRYYGEMLTPQEGRYLQNVKCGGTEKESIVLDEIASYLYDNLVPDCLYVIGAGSTTQAVKQKLSDEPGTLLGVDIYRDEQIVAKDVDEPALFALLDQNNPVKLIVTFTGAQGYLFGRGNQQLSRRILQKIGRDNTIVIATKTKIKSLNGRPLLLDTGDIEFDRQLSGLIPVCTGYEDHVIYRLGNDFPDEPDSQGG